MAAFAGLTGWRACDGVAIDRLQIEEVQFLLAADDVAAVVQPHRAGLIQCVL